MIKIVLFSENKKNIEKISTALSGKNDFNLAIRSYGKNQADKWDTGDIEMILLDIAGLAVTDKNIKRNFKSTAEIPIRSKTGRIIILDPIQKELLFEDPLFADEFLFTQNLEKEIIPRIDFLLHKMKVIIPEDSLVIGDMVLNLEKYELSIGTEVIVLTFKEFEMLKLFMQNIDRVFTRIDLLSTVWGYDYYGGSRTVDVHMRRLRAKIPPPYNNMLKTIRNVGYMFSPGK
jgi:two-component system alkaline phosphatase synthesis response regulator PhoP